MPTGKEISYNNFMLLMNFADTEFNRIYKTLLEAEMLNPGAATALLQDIRAQEISIREERKDLSRIFAEGMKIDAETLQQIQKAQLDLESARARTEADIKIQSSKAAMQKEEILADLRTSFEEERQTAQGRGSKAAFTRGEREQDVLNSTPRDARALQPATKEAAKAQLERRANDLLNEVFAPELAKTTDAYEKTAMLDAAKAQVKSGLTNFSRVGTYQTQLGDELSKAIDEAADNAFKARETDAAKQVKEQEKKQEELLNEVDAVGAGTVDFGTDLYPALKVKAMQLGIPEAQAETVLARVGTEAPTYNDIVVEAAVNARQLPSMMNSIIEQNTINGETYSYVSGLEIDPALAGFDTPEKLREGLKNNDPAAQELYNKVLAMQPSQIRLLQEGDYPRRLYENELDAIKLDQQRRQTKQKLMEGQDINVLDIHNKAMRIWQDLYGAKTPKMDVRRTAQRIRETYEDDEVADVLRTIAKEDGFSARQINKLDKTIRKMERAETTAELAALRREANKVRVGGLSEIKFRVQGEDYTLPELKREVDRQFEAGEYTDERQKAAFDQSINILERAVEEGTLSRRAIRQTQRAFDFMAEDVLKKEEEPKEEPPARPGRGLPIDMPEEVPGVGQVEEPSDEEKVLVAAFQGGMTSPTNNPNGVGDQARPAAMNKVGKGVLSMANVAMAGQGGGLDDRREVAREIAKKTLEEQGVSPETIQRAEKYKNQYATLYRLTEDQSRITMDDLSKIDPLVNKDVELATAASLFGTVDAAFPDEQA